MNETFPALAVSGLSVELTALFLSMILGIVQILLSAATLTAERGAKYGAGPRDEVMPPPGKLAGRFERAYRNFLETFPFFAAAILAAIITNRQGPATALGAELYLIGRVLYLPLYALGIPYLRTLAWLVAGAGIVLVIANVLSPAPM